MAMQVTGDTVYYSDGVTKHAAQLVIAVNRDGTPVGSLPEADWQYAAASGGIVNTADNVLVAAAAAGIRNYLTRMDILNTDTSVGTEVVINDGSTVIWRQFFPASVALVSQLMPVSLQFPTPLKGTAATALNVQCITTSANVYVNACGYQAT